MPGNCRCAALLGVAELEVGLAHDVAAALHEVDEDLRFPLGIAGHDASHVASERAEELFHFGEAIGKRNDHDLAAVLGIGLAADESGFREAVDDAGDGAGGEASFAGELSGGDAAHAQDVIEAAVIAGVKAEAFGDGVVEQDALDAHLASQFAQLKSVIVLTVRGQ